MDAWESHAGWWQREFTGGADEEYVEQIIPLATGLLAQSSRVLDIGAGEGQIARALMGVGTSSVVGVDPARNQIDEAAKRAGGPTYARGSATALPFAAQSFDGVVACLVFEHIDEMDEAIDEVARVLVVGGRFVFMLNHPLLQTPGSGWIDDHTMDPPEQYWRVGPYLTESSTEEEVLKDVFIPFVHRPLSRYVNAMCDSGLVLERMVEPAPPSGFVERAAEYGEASAIPRLLVLVASKR